eukprot:SAG11_NODE_9368_length_918_cov_2.247863_1_plen_26_part_01
MPSCKRSSCASRSAAALHAPAAAAAR